MISSVNRSFFAAISKIAPFASVEQAKLPDSEGGRGAAALVPDSGRIAQMPELAAGNTESPSTLAAVPAFAFAGLLAIFCALFFTGCAANKTSPIEPNPQPIAVADEPVPPSPAAVQNHPLRFGDVRERFVGDCRATNECFLDLDTGDLKAPPVELTRDSVANLDEIAKWAHEVEIDAYATLVLSETSHDSGLMTFGSARFIPTQMAWDNCTADNVVDCYGENQQMGKGMCETPPLNGAPANMVVLTSQGRLGLLQLVRADEPCGIAIRYKMVEGWSAGPTRAYVPNGTPEEFSLRNYDISDLTCDLPLKESFLLALARMSSDCGWILIQKAVANQRKLSNGRNIVIQVDSDNPDLMWLDAPRALHADMERFLSSRRMLSRFAHCKLIPFISIRSKT